tara:strand:- start:1634 stop:2470 length:837 start_codon:yes stop_codon:yes gene_type:complete
MRKIYPQDLQKLKDVGKKFATITAYDYTSSKIVNDIGFPVVLVGDSASMVVYGYQDTTPITMDEMMFVLRSVIRGATSSLIVADMPFLSYQPSTEEAIKNAGKFIKSGANAVKIEGGAVQSKKISHLVSSGIPVMGHIGLLPQSINATSGYRVQGKDELSANEIINDALEVEKAGAFSIVLEGIPGNLAKIISQKIKVPTIGIGSGPHCDGQIQVFHDLLGLDKTFNPRHAKKFINSYELFFKALENYKNDVERLKFPKSEHYINLSKDIEDKITGNN